MTTTDSLYTHSFDIAGLRAALAQHPFITRVIFQPILDSTNDLAKEEAGKGVPEGLLVLADGQTAGRGRMGRPWWAPVGSALLASLLFRPVIPAEITNAGGSHSLQQLVMLCALAASDAITDQTGLPVELKWPNDLIVHGRKLAGVLAEAIFKGDRLDSVIVGTGINVNVNFENAPSFIAPATSLMLELGYPVDRLSLLVTYLDAVARRYRRFTEGRSPYDEWVSRLATLGQHVIARLGDQTVHDERPLKADHPRHLSGIAAGVDLDGALLLRTEDGTVHRLLAADVSLQSPPRLGPLHL